MQVTVEPSEGLEKRLSVELPASRLTEEVEKRLRQLGRRVRLDGFRPGKVPLRVIKQRFGLQVRQEVAQELVQSTFIEAATQENLHPVGEPHIELSGGDEESAFGYTATFEVMPVLDQTKVEGLPIKRPAAEVIETDIDEMIEKLRKQRVTWHQVERPAQQGDSLKIDFRGLIDGEAFPGGTAEDFALQLGSGSMIEGFESGLVGAAAGESRILNLKFPDEYRVANLAGKAVTFETSIKEVSEPELPAVDAEFVKALGVEGGSLEELRKDVRENMERELRQKLRSLTKEQVVKALLEANPVATPKVLVQAEAERLKRQAQAEVAKHGQGQVIDFPVAIFEEQAERRVATGILMGHIVQEQQLQADEDRVRGLIEEMASAFENPNEVVDYYTSDREQRSNFERLSLEEQVVDWVLGRAEVEEQVSSFAEIMGAETS